MAEKERMSVADWIQYINLLMEAVSSGRAEAKDLKDMTEEQHAEYKARLVAESNAEIERGKNLQNRDLAGDEGS